MKPLRSIFITFCLAISAMTTGVYAASGTEISMPVADILPTIGVRSGEVHVENTSSEPIEVAVFSITGTMVKNMTVESGENCNISLPAGYYIVKAGKATKRIAIKG